LAAALCLIELLSSLQKPLSRHAWFWVALRLVFEGGWGAIAYAVFATTPGLTGISQWIRAILAGFTGSAILRLQLAVSGKGRSRGIGPGVVYQNFCRKVDANIDDIGGVAQSNWITYRVLPTLQYLSVAAVVEQTETYLNNLSRLTDRQRQAITTFIHDTASEDSTSDQQKRRALVQRVIDEGGTRFIKSLVKEYSSSTSSAPGAPAVAAQVTTESMKKT
jgi:hypothetical protein